MIKFTSEKKEAIILEFQNSNESAKDIMKKYGIQKPHTIYRWNNVYKLYGLAGFQNKRGRKYKQIDNINERDIKITKDDEIIRLRKELSDQKTKNIYLQARVDLMEKSILSRYKKENKK